MSVTLVLLLLVAAVSSSSPGGWSTISNTSELLARAGYQSERHTVESQDGFQLSVFRIPGPGIPIFVMHGLFTASDSWVLRGRGRDLVLLLADQGYDVWLADARGNHYSRSHNTFNPSDSAFWDFSMHEMGVFDLPAVIDYVLNATGHSSLVYMGHSLGTMVMYVMSARKPEYVYKVRLMVGLAPAAFMRRYHSPALRFLLESSSSYSAYFGRLGVHEVFPRNPLMAMMARPFCSTNSPTQHLCLRVLNFVGGYGNPLDFSHINKTLLPEIMSHVPAGASAKTLAHLGQLSQSGRFCGYDYGPEENLARYGSRSPPDYDLSKTSMPVINFHGEGDITVDARDAEDLSANLPNLIADVVVDNPLFNHVDFIWAEDANELVYQRVLEVIAKYSNY